MFERYTKEARQLIFFARYEVSQLGASAIESEHLLLGLLRADEALLSRFLPAHIQADSIRKQIEDRITPREKIAASVEVPLSTASKNILHYALLESESLSHKEIDVEHLLLGLLREEDSLAARILLENGVEYAAVRKELEK